MTARPANMFFNRANLLVNILLIYLSATQINSSQDLISTNYSPPLYFTQVPHTEYIYDNSRQSPLMLDCSARSQHRSSIFIRWTRGKDPVNTGFIVDQSYDSQFKREIFSNGSLKLTLINEYSNIYNVNESNAVPTFKCFASDSFGTILTSPIRIYQTYDGSSNERILKYFRQPGNKTLSQGDRLLLKCKPVLNVSNARTKIKHKWYKNNKRILFDSKTVLYKDGTLEISAVSISDSGTYKCIARYRSYSFNSRQAFVNVLESKPLITFHKQDGVTHRHKPKFDAWPEDVSVAQSEEAIFECKALDDQLNANLKYAYTWLKDGVVLDLDKQTELQLVQGNNLQIEKTQRNDAGVYTCQICSVLEETLIKECDIRNATLQVLVYPYFLKRPLNLNTTVKSSVEFECSAFGIPPPTIQWFKNGEPIYPSDYFHFDSNRGNLKILGIISQDEGYYQCLANNQLGTIQSVASLTVHSDHTLINEKVKKSTLIHKPSTLAATTPVPMPKSVVHLSAPISLELVQATASSLEINWKQPSIIKEITGVDGHETNKQITYMVKWSRDKKISSETNHLLEANTSTPTLVIEDLEPDTLYKIQVCAVLASTKGPYTSLTTRTKEELKLPSKPLDFKAEFIDFNYHKTMTPTLKFKWKKPVVNAMAIRKYRLFYEHLHFGLEAGVDTLYNYPAESVGFYNSDQYFIEDYGADDAPVKYLDIDTPNEAYQFGSLDSSYEFLLEDLKKYSTYKFRLVGVNDLMEKNNITGQNNEGAELIVETPSDVPDGPPKHLQAETINTTAIFVQWSPPAQEKCNGLILGYRLAIKENDKQVWNSDEQNEPRNKLINNLLPNRKYSIRVTARTVNGSGPASDWIVAETFAHEMDETTVPGQPLELFAEPTDKSIVIHWVPPKDSNVTLVRKYLLSYGVNFPTNMIEIAGNRNSYIIKDLEPSSTYILSLKAKNNAGFGKEILKDIVTKRKSALADHENLFPPLNVQAVAISPHSIEVRWTDWHLKQEEAIPDDRYYTVQYSTAEMSSENHSFVNSTERNVIVSNLNADTLYDFAVRLVIGMRKSDWSMTTSQMTMESSPAPRDIRIKSDPEQPSNVIITWQAPNYSVISGYVISFLDVDSYSQLKMNSKADIKWQHNYVTANEQQKSLQAVVRKLKTDTKYYFKIQARNNRAYGSSSPTIIYQTPNNKGIGGGIIFTPDEPTKNSKNTDTDNFPSVHATKSSSLQRSFFLLVVAVGSSFFILVLIILITCCCRRGGDKTGKKINYSETTSMKRNYNIDESNVGNQSMHHQQQMLINNMNNPNNYGDMIQQNVQGVNHINFSINSSTTSTLLKQQNALRTPSHHVANPLQIANPNHIAMLMMNPLSVNNNTNTNGPQSSNNNTHLSNANTSQNDVEFYSNMTSQQVIGTGESANFDNCYQYNHPYGNVKQNYSTNMRTSSINDDSSSQNQEDLNKDLTSASEALAAANAAFNAPIVNYSMNQQGVNNMPQNENLFMRSTARPKPIAMPISTVPGVSPGGETNGIHANASIRKSFKNLPMATATLIQSNQSASNMNSNNSPNHPLSFNFNDLSSKQQQSQKIHYTARPYIIDNQVQSNGEYSIHSPASSCHSSSQQSQVYDKLGNPTNPPNHNAVSTKSLLQPLKSFGSSNNAHPNQIASVQPSSFSIPNTPAKYCENLNSNLCNVAQSPGKKMANQGQQVTANGHGKNYKSKSIENLHEKKLSISHQNNNEELTAEMANLEGIMKDLNAITAQQFEC